MSIFFCYMFYVFGISFFFWINKNLFPKGQSPTKNTHEVKKDPKKRKKDSTSPKTEEKGHQPETKIHLINISQSPTYGFNQHKQPNKTEQQTQHPHTGTTNKTTKQNPTAQGRQTKPKQQAHIPGTGRTKPRTTQRPGQGTQLPNSVRPTPMQMTINHQNSFSTIQG